MEREETNIKYIERIENKMKRIVDKKKNDKKKKPVSYLKKSSRRNHWSEEHDKMMEKIIRNERDEKEIGNEQYFIIIRNTNKTKSSIVNKSPIQRKQNIKSKKWK